jgi:hypothetical protein
LARIRISRNGAGEMLMWAGNGRCF